jgi:tetratricopeptide (TPR) repeat protein
MLSTTQNAGLAPSATVTVCVTGPFAVVAADGSDLTPKPQKSRALLAMLALAPEHRRHRRWLMERLWGDRAAGQAAGSLRQALVDLKRSLGPAAGILVADREWIGLLGDSVRIDSTRPGEFLEGIGVQTPAFMAWRQKHLPIAAEPARVLQPLSAAAPSQQSPVLLAWGTTLPPGTVGALAGDVLASRVAGGAAERVTAWTLAVSRNQIAVSGASDVDILCDVIQDNGICLVFLRAIHPETGRALHARDLRFVGTPSALLASDEAAAAVYDAIERLVGALPHVLGASRPVTRSTALAQLALHKMFSFDQSQLGDADSLLERAYETHESSVFLAWRGLLQMIRSIEDPARAAELRETAEALTSYATARGQGNATVSALASQTRAMLFGDTRGALASAQQAIDENPGNPLALQAMAIARMLAGEDEDAYQLSLRGRTFASRSAFRHWWDAHHCTICVATRRHDEAIAAAEAALVNVPSFRPAYRFLMSLYAEKGEIASALAMKDRLERIEPGFTLDRMLNDPDYPVRTLRRTGLISAIRKLL